jgi:hypothetical protein
MRFFNDDPESHTASVVCFFMGITVLLILLIFIEGCKTAAPQLTQEDVYLWAGDSKSIAISRSQFNLLLYCTDPEFDNYVCMTYDELERFFNRLQECR